MAVDLVGFHSLVQQVDHAQLTQLHGSYVQVFDEVVAKNKGVVQWFVGDHLLAAFNASTTAGDHPTNACRAALECNGLLKARAGPGQPQLEATFGICTGMAVVGNMGYERHMRFCVLSPLICLAFAISKFCRKLGTTALVTAVVAESAKVTFVLRYAEEMEAQPADLSRCTTSPPPTERHMLHEVVRPKDFAMEEWMYQLDTAEKAADEFDTYNRGMKALLEGRRTEGLRLLEEHMALHPRDRLAQYHLTKR